MKNFRFTNVVIFLVSYVISKWYFTRKRRNRYDYDDY